MVNGVDILGHRVGVLNGAEAAEINKIVISYLLSSFT